MTYWPDPFAVLQSKTILARCYDAGKPIGILARPSVHIPRKTNGQTSGCPLFVRGLLADAALVTVVEIRPHRGGWESF